MVFRGYIGLLLWTASIRGRAEKKRRDRTDFLRCSTRLYVVVMLDLWDVRCLRVLSTDRDGGGIWVWPIGDTSFRIQEQLERVFSFLSG